MSSEPQALALPPPNLPALHPAQTLYSWCGEVHRWNGNPMGIDTSLQLFGSARAGFYHDFPSHLDALVERTGGALGSARQLALGHTLLGYYLPFVPAQRAEQILAGVCQGTVARLKFHLALPRSGVGADHPLKGCDSCFDGDEGSGQHPYWRMEHQWPSVFVCRTHGEQLAIATYSHTPVHRRDWLLPRSGPPREWIQRSAPSGPALEIQRRLADLSAWVAVRPPSSLLPEDLARTYRTGLREAGLVTTGGRADEERIGQWLRQRYGPLATLPGMTFLDRAPAVGSMPWWTLAVSDPARLHPVKQLLMIDALFSGWVEFEAALAASGAPADPGSVADARPTDPARDPRLARFASLVRGGLSISAAARQTGHSAGTGVRWAKLLGIPYTPRTKSLEAETLEQVRRLLAEGRPKPEITEITGISAVSLDRLISSEPKVRGAWNEARASAARETHRRRFIEVLADHPGLTVSEIRRIPGNGFHWLYRNDRQWLAEHLPAIWQPTPDES